MNIQKNFVMKFDSIEAIKNEGFEGFLTLGSLMEKNSPVPKAKGIYFILYTQNEKPEFVETGSGGFYKDMDPNVPIDELHENWVENTIVLYIGRAGKGIGNTTLRDRLRQYFSFGRGKRTGHRGGRYVWQIKNYDELIVCWKKVFGEDPRDVEAALIKEFYDTYRKRPFANLAGQS
jgi:hypothetical protein